MRDNLVLRSAEGGKLVFSDLRLDEDKSAVEQYRVSLAFANMTATAEVYAEPIYAPPPTKFFAELARMWRGWDGNKRWNSLEGELELECTRDKLGHIELRCALRPDWFPPPWHVHARILLEAGQLEIVAAEISDFFREPRPNHERAHQAQAGTLARAVEDLDRVR
jgi:hypothetical protein